MANKILDPNGKEIKFRKAEGNDVRHDGRQALGRLVPGTYRFHYATDKQIIGVYYLRGDSHQTVQRDVNHDGYFTEQDIWHTDTGDTIVETGDFAILIHSGIPANTFSGACQTISRPNMEKFLSKLDKTQRNFFYILISLR